MAEIFKTVHIEEDLLPLRPQGIANTLQESIDSAKLNESGLHERMEQVKNEAFELGFNQGLTQAKAEMVEQTTSLSTLLQSIPEAIRNNRLQLSDEIADIVLVIAQQFFINQQHNKNSIASQISQTIAHLNNKQNIELRLHSQDLALLQQGLLTIDVQQCKNLRITPDDNLQLGGCIVHSDHGVFNASIERQIDNLKQMLLQIKQGEHHA